jgi:hypothetical protein
MPSLVPSYTLVTLGPCKGGPAGVGYATRPGLRPPLLRRPRGGYFTLNCDACSTWYSGVVLPVRALV